jgi:hypothetical protein
VVHPGKVSRTLHGPASLLALSMTIEPGLLAGDMRICTAPIMFDKLIKLTDGNGMVTLAVFE